jgi:hypothetical protein
MISTWVLSLIISSKHRALTVADVVHLVVSGDGVIDVAELGVCAAKRSHSDVVPQPQCILLRSTITWARGAGDSSSIRRHTMVVFTS